MEGSTTSPALWVPWSGSNQQLGWGLELGPAGSANSEQGVILVTEHNAEVNAGFAVLRGSNHAPPLLEEDWQSIPLGSGESQDLAIRKYKQKLVSEYWKGRNFKERDWHTVTAEEHNVEARKDQAARTKVPAHVWWTIQRPLASLIGKKTTSQSLTGHG